MLWFSIILAPIIFKMGCVFDYTTIRHDYNSLGRPISVTDTKNNLPQQR